MKAATHSDFKAATFLGFFGTVAGFVSERFPQGEERWTTTGQVSLHGHVEENIAREKVVHVMCPPPLCAHQDRNYS
jgi:hypothetical protein